MEVHCFSTGRVRPKRSSRGLRRWLPGGWSDRTLPVNVFVVVHAAGVCLFDTGQTAAASRRGYFPVWHPFFRLSRFEVGPGDEAAPQLVRLGLDPGSVRWVVLSHLHTDHVGGLAAFRGAEVLVSRLEWQRSRGIAGRVRGYLPGRWPRGLEPTLVDFEGGEVGPFPASHDVGGDRRLLLVPLPGHTPGHMGLLVRDESRSVLLAGDAVPSPATESLDPRLIAFCRDEGIRLLATHCAEVLDASAATSRIVASHRP